MLILIDYAIACFVNTDANNQSKDPSVSLVRFIVFEEPFALV